MAAKSSDFPGLGSLRTGGRGHGSSLYEELIRVPLVIKPGNDPHAPAPGGRIAGPAESVDVFSTILDHAGLPQPMDLDGSPWARARTHARSWRYSHPPRGVTAAVFEREQRAVVHDGWKLIESSDGEVELYHLSSDPGELEDLAASRPGQASRLAALLGPRAPRSSGEAPEEDPELLQRLRDLGYVE